MSTQQQQQQSQSQHPPQLQHMYGQNPVSQQQQLYLQMQLLQQQQQQQAYQAATAAGTYNSLPLRANNTYDQTFHGQSSPSTYSDSAQALRQQQAELELQITLQQLKLNNETLRMQIQQRQQAEAMAAYRQQQQQLYNAANNQDLSGAEPWNAGTLPPFKYEEEDQQNIRKGALRNLQQARKQREPGSSKMPTPASAAPSLDWQLERLRYASSSQSSSSSSNSEQSKAGANSSPSLVDDSQSGPAAAATGHHRKTSSLASTASSTHSAAHSDSSSVCSPNRGPALVLSKPYEEFPEDEEDEAIYASPQELVGATSVRSQLDQSKSGGGSEDKSILGSVAKSDSKGKTKRHTVILSSSLPTLAASAKTVSSDVSRTYSGDSTIADASSQRGETLSESGSSGSSSPTSTGSPVSDRSDPASFDSPDTAATAASMDDDALLKLHEQADTSILVQKRIVTAPSKTVGQLALNPTASAFMPTTQSTQSGRVQEVRKHTGTETPSGRSTPVGGPFGAFRVFSAPTPTSAASSGFGTPLLSNGVTIVRQPKGPANEADLSAKNFSGMIRRKAVGTLKLAAFSGGRTSPLPSPVTGEFPSTAFQSHVRHTTSPPVILSSPAPSSATFATFGAELAQRALKRRSQQMALGHGVNPGF